jgi:hypothetical protein
MKVTILPPKNCAAHNIKHDIRQLKSGFVDIAVYPNDVEVVITYINGRANVESSKPLVKIDELTYQIPE